ncbi:hypothetical protein SEA_REYNAULD_69 [Rhodococcus phage Reynauld]|uniref:Uncharacterized protein n=1 Tax=Rhodococcus phage Reynauld TaxID=3062845 RepID=A0ACD4UJ87_9CAUD|nr:hypothetical protein SEA_REYNAULD_69 [Rhodococcus phage Reynauld]
MIGQPTEYQLGPFMKMYGIHNAATIVDLTTSVDHVGVPVTDSGSLRYAFTRNGNRGDVALESRQGCLTCVGCATNEDELITWCTHLQYAASRGDEIRLVDWTLDMVGSMVVPIIPTEGVYLSVGNHYQGDIATLFLTLTRREDRELVRMPFLSAPRFSFGFRQIRESLVAFLMGHLDDERFFHPEAGGAATSFGPAAEIDGKLSEFSRELYWRMYGKTLGTMVAADPEIHSRNAPTF